MCAIFGIIGTPEASHFTYLGLHALQHRGQEGSGIVATDGTTPKVHKQMGLVSDNFNSEVLAKLSGIAAIGHNRYSTAGGSFAENLQPIQLKCSLGWVSIAHNGNLVNAVTMAKALEKEGAIFQATSDTEVILHLMARSQKPKLEDALVTALKQVEGAYSLLLMNNEKMIAIRDPFGFRPMVMGTLNGATVFASETTAFDLIGAKYLREVAPGEMIVIDLKNTGELRSTFPLERELHPRRCIFEMIYFARPDSQVFGASVHYTRKALGRQLAKEQPVVADVVIPVPDSGVPAAIGFAEESKIPFDMGIIRSHYIGRTFIEPKQSIRNFGVKLKLNPVAQCVGGKRVVIVDDSLVRGTTSKKLIQHLRQAGALEVHVRISAPPTTHSCFYGIDTPTRKELLASHQTIEDIRKFIGADSLGYLTLQGLMKVAKTQEGDDGFCHACFSGEYPTAIV